MPIQSTNTSRYTSGVLRKSKKQKKRKSSKSYAQKSGTRKHSQKKCNDNIDCEITHFRDHKYPNQVWNTCITLDGITKHILYITPKNVIIKSIDTIQVPRFVAKINKTQMECTIAFTPVCNESVFTFSFNTVKRCNKQHYVSCFLRHCGTWYAIMIQPYSAIYNVHLFYKINHVKNMLNNQGEVVFSNKNMVMGPPSNGHGFKELTLNPDYLEEIVETSPIYPLLKRFVTEKIVANVAKQMVVGTAIGEATAPVIEPMTDEIFENVTGIELDESE